MAQMKDTYKLPTGQWYESFEKSMNVYMASNYPDFKSGQEHSYFVPPFVQSSYKGPLGEASGAPVALPGGKNNRLKGWQSELKVVECLQKLDSKYPQPMFVFSNLNLQSLFSWLKKDLNLRDATKGLVVPGREIDILIIHKVFGMFIFEIKSTKKVASNDACQQLYHAGRLLQSWSYIHSDEGSKKLSITFVHAYPNQDLNNASYPCDGVLGRMSCPAYQLDKSVFESPDSLLEFLQKTGSGMTNDYYGFMIPRLIAGKSAVSAYIEMTHLVLTQSHLKDTLSLYRVFKQQESNRMGHQFGSLENVSEMRTQTFEKKGRWNSAIGIMEEFDFNPDYVNSYLNTVRSTGLDRRLAVLVNEWKFLNPEQQKIWYGADWQLIVGPFGSGKTILLRYKALDLLRNNQNVLILACFPLGVEYRSFLRANEASFIRPGRVPQNLPQWRVLCFDSKTDTMQENICDLKMESINLQIQRFAAQTPRGFLNVFIDESQQCPYFEQIHRVVKKCEPHLYWVVALREADRHNEIMYLSFNYERDFNRVEQGMAKNNVRMGFARMAGPIIRNKPPSGTEVLMHQENQMTTSMRSTRNIYLYKYGIPSFRLGHQVVGPPVKTILCKDLAAAVQIGIVEIEQILSPRLTILGARKGFSYDQVNEQLFDPAQILVAFSLCCKNDRPLLAAYIENMKQKLNEKEIPVCSLVDHANGRKGITMCKVPEDELSSFEWHVVIIIRSKDQENLLDYDDDGRPTYATMCDSDLKSRCIFQLIVIEHESFSTTDLLSSSAACSMDSLADNDDRKRSFSF